MMAYFVDIFTPMNPTKLACKLTSPELRERKRTAVADLKSLLLEKSETATGYKYKFEGSDRLVDLLTAFIKTERMCCPFFEFTLTVAGDESYAWLELSGREGVKEFIDQEIEF
jgi:hypothetical protein